MSKRHTFIAKLESQLEEWTAELRELEAKAEHAEVHLRDKYRHAIEELHEKRVAAETKLEEIRHSSEEAWEGLKDEAEKSWAAFRAGIDAWRDFSDHS